jgi:hypothetical protein
MSTVTLTFDEDYAAMARGLRYFRKARPRIARPIPAYIDWLILVALLLIGVTSSGLVIELTQLQWLGTVIFAIVFIGGFAQWRIRSRRYIQSRITAELRALGAPRRIAVTLGESDIRISSENSEHRYAWSAVSVVSLSPNGVILMADLVPHFIPASAFDSTDAAQHFVQRAERFISLAQANRAVR